MEFMEEDGLDPLTAIKVANLKSCSRRCPVEKKTGIN
jgi:hypothetical protein